MKNIEKQFLEDLEFRYRYLTAVRYSRKQKDKFIDIFRREMNHLGIRNDSINLVKKGKAVNIIVGDVDNADVVIINNYDTPPFTLFNKKWFPLNWKKQQETMIRSIVFMMVGIALTTLLAYFVLDRSGAFDPIPGKTNYLFSIFAIISTAVMLRVVNGIGIKDKLQYTSPQIMMDVLLSKELLAENVKFALILTDFGYQRHIGDTDLKEIDFKNKKVYFISDLVGDKIDILSNKEAMNSIVDIIPNVRTVTTAPVLNGEHLVESYNSMKPVSLDTLQTHYEGLIKEITQH